jgi:hypothetical protein
MRIADKDGDDEDNNNEGAHAFQTGKETRKGIRNPSMIIRSPGAE